MPDTARPRKQTVAPSDEGKRERINARRRLRRAEIRCEKARAASVAASEAVDKANYILLRLLGELKLSMKAVGQTKPRKVIVKVSDDWLEQQMSTPKSKRAANKVAKILSSTSIYDAMESA